MRYLAIAIMLLSPVLAQGADSVWQEPRQIIGGEDTDSREFPTVLKVGGCTGSLVAERWALTAAHCAAGKNPSGMQVERGYPEDYETRKSTVVVVHPAYVQNPNWTRNDIALVQFDRPFESSTIQIQKLANSTMSELLTKPGTMTISVGWGRIGKGTGTDKLQTAQWPIAPCPSTSEFEGYVITDEVFCRKNTPWESQIHIGDSGGPVLVQHQGELWQIGHITYNANAQVDGKWQYYSISQKSAPYLDWIQETIDITPLQEFTTLEQDFKELHQLARELDDELRAMREKLVDLIYGIDALRIKTWDTGAK